MPSKKPPASIGARRGAALCQKPQPQSPARRVREPVTPSRGRVVGFYICDAFSPAIEIKESGNFVGRKEEVEEAVMSLLKKGSIMMIIGQRGVGKTSLACQVANIAMGDTSLLKKLNLERLMPRSGFKFSVFKYEIDTAVESVSDLLEFMLQGDASENSLRTAAGLDRKLVESGEDKEVSAKMGIANVFQLGGKGKGSKKYDHIQQQNVNLEFRKALNKLSEHDDFGKQKKIVIIIDEFDLISDKEGFGSLLKACSSENIKFVLIGVASTIGELLKDHASVGRKKDVVHVDRMKNTDLDGIIFNAQNHLGNALTFEQSVIDKIVDHSDGFPYFTQLMGQFMALNANKCGRNTVMDEDFEEFFSVMREGRLDSLYSNMYHEVVESNAKRPAIILAASQRTGETFSTGDILGYLSGVSQPQIRIILNALTKEIDGYSPILHKVRLDNYRFIDPLFKTYCRLYAKMS